MLNIVAWYWGRKYTPKYLDRLVRGLRRHLRQPHRFMVLTDQSEALSDYGYECHDIRDRDLLNVRGCFARLRMFDPQWQRDLGLKYDPIICIDLDSVFVGPLDPLFERTEPFVILHGANQSNPCPYTACIFMLQPGAHPEVWTDFSFNAAQTIPKYEFPDDQGWIHYMVPNAAAWHVGKESGIWSFRKRGWPTDDVLPTGARLICFPGARDPAQFTQLDWVKKHWVLI